MSSRLGILFDPRCLHHRIEQFSLENPERIRNLQALVQERFGGRYGAFTAREASMSAIEAVHSRFYLEQIRELARHPNPYAYDPDTYLMKESFHVARLAAGGCLKLADEIVSGNIDSGFALVRPPGHHAEPGRGMGFCLLNNVAIAARYLEEHYQFRRILIVDYDVHHGNGTQEVFYDSAQVLFVSIHQSGLFPTTSGGRNETGRGEGRGYTFNVPVHPQFGDVEYTFLLGRLLQGIVEHFMPQIILVSAGFDGHRDDPISSVLLSTRWFGIVATMLKQYAADCCENRLLFVLEGGYNPISLEASVIATIDSLLAPDVPRVGVLHSERAERVLRGHPLLGRWNIRIGEEHG